LIILKFIMVTMVHTAALTKAITFSVAGGITFLLLCWHVKQVYPLTEYTWKFAIFSLSHLVSTTANSACFFFLVSPWTPHSHQLCTRFGVSAKLLNLIVRITLWLFYIQRTRFVIKIIIRHQCWWKFLNFLRYVTIVFFLFGVVDIVMTEYGAASTEYPVCDIFSKHRELFVALSIFEMMMTFIIAMSFVASLAKHVENTRRMSLGQSEWSECHGVRLMKNEIRKMLLLTAILTTTNFLWFIVDVSGFKGVRTFFIAADHVLSSVAVVIMFWKRKKKQVRTDTEIEAAKQVH